MLTIDITDEELDQEHIRAMLGGKWTHGGCATCWRGARKADGEQAH